MSSWNAFHYHLGYHTRYVRITLPECSNSNVTGIAWIVKVYSNCIPMASMEYHLEYNRLTFRRLELQYSTGIPEYTLEYHAE